MLWAAASLGTVGRVEWEHSLSSTDRVTTRNDESADDSDTREADPAPVTADGARPPDPGRLR